MFAVVSLGCFLVGINIRASILVAEPEKLDFQPPQTVSIPSFAPNNVTSPRIVLIHIGKTGGESIRHSLRITCRQRRNPEERLKCRQQMSDHSESALSLHTVGTLHCQQAFPSGILNEADTFLFTLRSPLSRIVSWFRYTHPQNCRLEKDYYSTACNTKRSIESYRIKQRGSAWPFKFFRCFPTLGSLAEAVRDKDHPCSSVAKRTLLGGGPTSSGHAYFNYQYYWNQTMAIYSNITVLGVRTETLWDDVMQVELELGGSTSSMMLHNVTHGSEGHERDQLSVSTRTTLCCTLRKEMITYGALLKSATNLFDIEDTLEQVAVQCGAPSWEALVKGTFCGT